MGGLKARKSSSLQDDLWRLGGEKKGLFVIVRPT
jgi:hypothetical protein